MRSLQCFAAAVIALSVPSSSLARASGAGHLETVGEGVYAIIHDTNARFPDGNTGVVVGDDGVLVVDAGYLPSTARADIALIRTVTDKPVRYVVYTHWQFDHNNGGIAYKEAFPGVTIVTTRAAADNMAINSPSSRGEKTAPGSPAIEELRDLESRLRSGFAGDGRRLTDEQRATLEAEIRRRDDELHQLSRPSVVEPNLVFDDRLTLCLGSRRVELLNRGHANSPADTTIYVPDAKVLFTADVVVHAAIQRSDRARRDRPGPPRDRLSCAG